MFVIEELWDICEKGATAEAVKALFHHPEFPEEINRFVNEDGWSPLMVAVYNGHKQVVEEFLNIQRKAILESRRLPLNLYYRSPSGLTAMDVAVNHKEIVSLLTDEDGRRKRLKTGAHKMGYHETNKSSFDYIANDADKRRYPMIGGNGGYFGGGVYFATTTQESSRKALHNGYGFKCRLAMGHIYYIQNYNELNTFRNEFCDGTNQYNTPTDVMQQRLLEKGYDSVWGHYDDDPKTPIDERILKTGDEYVVYSADQISIQMYYDIRCKVFLDVIDNRDIYSKSVHWEPLDRNNSLIPPTRPARYFSLKNVLKETPDKPWPINQVRHWLACKGIRVDLQTGDLVEFRTEDDNETVGKYVCIYQRFKTDEKWLLYAYTEEMQNITQDLIINDDSPSVYISKNSLSWIGLKTLPELLTHYLDVILAHPTLLMVQMTEKPDPNYPWDNWFPVLKDTVKYHYAIKNFFHNGAYLVRRGTEMYLFLDKNDELKLEKIEPSMSTERQLQIIASMYRPYKNVSFTLTMDAYVILEKQKYTFKKFFNLANMVSVFPTFQINTSKTSKHTLVIDNADMTDFIQFQDAIMYSHWMYKEDPIGSIPLFHKIGDTTDNGVIESTTETENYFYFKFYGEIQFLTTKKRDVLDWTHYLYSETWLKNMLTYCDVLKIKNIPKNGKKIPFKFQSNDLKLYSGVTNEPLMTPLEEMKRRLTYLIHKSNIHFPIQLSPREMT
jgi:hypothetical protein